MYSLGRLYNLGSCPTINFECQQITPTESTLQAINKWIGGGAKLSLSRSPDGDVLKVSIIKLQKRVKVGAATLLIKVKAHRGDPRNEEVDIRAEMGRLKEDNEKTWTTQTDRTIYKWSNHPKPRKGLLLPKRQCGPMRFGIECDRKQGKYKRSEPSKGEWRNGAESTPNGMKPTLSQKKVKTS